MASREQDAARFANTVLAAVLAMPAPRVAFSDKTAAAIPLLARGQTIVRDADLPGFFILVGTRGKTYMVQADLWAERKRQSVRVKIGEVDRVSAREARATAKVLLGSIANGIDPRPKADASPAPATPVEGLTLRQAWESYRTSHMERKARSAGTIGNYRDGCLARAKSSVFVVLNSRLSLMNGFISYQT